MANNITKADIQRWLDAGNTLDADKLGEVMADNVVMHQPQNPKPLSKSELISFFRMLWKAFPDMHFASVGMTIEGNEAASWERVTGTLKGPYTDPSSGKQISPTNRKFDVYAAMRLTFDDQKKLSEVRIFWDRLDFMQQLGII